MEVQGVSDTMQEEVTGGVKIHKLFERSSIMSKIKQTQSQNKTAEGGNVEIDISKYQRTKSRVKDEDDEEIVMKSMESLSKASEVMNRSLRRQQQDTEERAKAAMQKQQEAALQISMKVATSQQELESASQQFQFKKTKLQQIQDSTLSKKSELVTLKQLKEQTAIQFKDEQDNEMIEKNNKINELTQILEQMRERQKKARENNSQIEININQEELQKVALSLKLNEMSNDFEKQGNLQHTSADFDKEVREAERLQARLKQLEKLRQQAQQKTQSLMTNIEELKNSSLEQNYQIQLVKSEATRQQLIIESNQLKNDNKILFDKNLDLLNEMKEMQVQVQLEETKNLESVVIANLLMDQNKFERYSRLVQVDIESIEDAQRLREDTRKELQNNLKQIEQETEITNAELAKNIADFKKKLQKSEIDKQELEDEIRALMAQVCNKRPEELKIEQIDNDYDRLVVYKQSLEQFKNMEQILQEELDALGKIYQEYEHRIKVQFHSESVAFIQENGSIIGSLGTDIKAITDKNQSIDAILREKVAHTEEQMQLLEQSRVQLAQIKASISVLKHDVDYEKGQLIDFKDEQEANESKIETAVQVKKGLQSYEVSVVDFVVVRRDLSDQNERLKGLNGKNIRDLLDLLDELAQQIALLDEALSTDQKEKCQRLIDEGKKLCDSIDQDIGQLQERLAFLEQETVKVDPDMRSDYISEIDKVKSTLNKLKSKKDALQAGLTDIALKEDTMVQNQGKLREIVHTLQEIQDKDLKQAEKEIDKIEEKMKVAIRQFKNDKKKECNNFIAKAESKLDSFNDAINNVQGKIDAISRECTRLEDEYEYGDKEREQDLADIRAELQKEQQKFEVIQANRDNFKEQVEDLKREAESLEQNNLSNNVEITNQWIKAIEKTKQLNNQMEPEIKSSISLEQDADQVKEKLTKIQDKHKLKNNLYQECLDKKKEKQALLDNYKTILSKSETQLEESKKQLDQMILVPGDKDFMEKYEDAKRQYEDGQQNLQKEKYRIGQLQERIDNTDSKLNKLGEEVVSNRDLTKIRDDLDKLELDLTYQIGQAKEINKEASELLVDVQDLYELNKQLKEKEIEQKLVDLSIDLAKADKLHKEAVDKLNKYQHLIQKALQSDDEGVVESANKLKQEAAEIEKELSYIETLKNNLRNQETRLRDKQLKLQANRSKSTVHDFEELSDSFGSVNDQSAKMGEDLARIIKDLDNRTNELDDYLKKFNDLQGMYKDFDTMLANLHNQSQIQSRQIEECELSVAKLQAVLFEMEKGVGRDYKLKEGLIVKQLNELHKVQVQYEQSKEQKNLIQQKINEVQEAGDQSLDNDALSELIGQVKQLQVQLENQDITINQCHNQIQECRSTVHDADIPQIIQIREKETTEFSKKLRKAENEFADLKKILLESKGLDNYRELEANYRDLEQQLGQFKENGLNFKRILGQELQLLLPNPQVLQDLDIQKQTVIKIILLGDQLNDALEEIDRFLVQAAKFKNQMGGLDLMKRHKELTATEQDHQKRLAEVKKRFDRIDKGAADCDGYTSNPEEGTFIETLLGELPSMQDKLAETVDQSDQVKNNLIDIFPAVQAANNEEAEDESSNNQLIENLDEVEEQVNSNERTVTFLEKLADKLENHFISMEVKKKLDKRQLELKELQNICTEFEQQLVDMQDHLRTDLEKIDRKKGKGDAQEMLVDEEGQKINLLEELLSVQEDLQEILDEVNDLAEKNANIQEMRDTAAQEFNDEILTKSPFKGQQRITNKADVFSLLRANGWMKRKIIEMIKAMKDVSRQLRDTKGRYQNARSRLQRSTRQKKIYKAVKGDLVDELFANYINMLNCPVPINRMGNNQYTFGTKKIYAKIINGKLVIRVGGGYMGIEEFMMYYGQQELLRIQKREYLMMDNDDNDLVEDSEHGSNDNHYQNGEDNNDNGAPPQRYYARGGLTKSIVERAGSPGGIRKKNKFDDSKEEQQNQNKKTTVVGLGDVRKALKQNLIEIKTYQDHSTVSKLSTAEDVQSRNQMHQNSATKRVAAESGAVKEELKTMEQQLAGSTKSRPQTMNNSYRQAMGSPKTSSHLSSKESSSRRVREDRTLNASQISPGMGSPKQKQASKIPTIKK